MTRAEVLERARAAVGRLDRHVLLDGPSRRNGLDGEVALALSPDGAFVDRFQGRVGTVVGFDGERGWGLDMSGMPMALDLDEIETPRLVFAIVSGRWLDEGAFDAQIEPARSDDRFVALRLGLRGGAERAVLLLERTTWLPHRLERPMVGWERTWHFDDYRPDSGITLPRRLTRTQGGLTEVDRFERLATQLEDPAPGYRAITTEPDDVRYDTTIAPRIELMKIRTGHVFVRPKIDGEEVGWFAFDTGSGAGFTILASVAERLGMPRFGELSGGGAGAAIQIASLRQGRTFELGPITIANSIYVEMPEELNATVKRLADIDVVGTCGYDLFRRCVVEMDLARGEAFLHPRDGGPRPDGWHELTLQHRIPGVRCRFEGGHEGVFQVDTGAGPLVLFHSPAVQRLGLLEGRAVRPMPVQGAAGSVDTMFGTLEWIEIAGQRRTGVPAMFVTGASGALADPYTLGTAGGILLAPKKLVFDYARRRMAVID
jgi:predicted aspartyl protease